jgi:CubicO group peptidase (beta-lactamase class C family)
LTRALLSTAGALALALASPAPARAADEVGGATAYPHEAEPIGSVREVYAGTLTPEMAVRTFRNTHRLFATRSVTPGRAPRPLPPAATALRGVAFDDAGRRWDLESYIEANRVAGLLVLKDGRVKLERYRFGNTGGTRWMSMSIAKSITSTLVGAALHEGRIASLADPVTRYVPALAGSAYDRVPVRDLLTMTSGVLWNEAYSDPTSDRRRLLAAQIAQEPGAALGLMRDLPRAAEPGRVSNYSTGETLVAAAVLRGALGLSLSEYLSERIWSRFAMEAEARWWLDAPGGLEVGGSGFSATLRDYGRFGLFFLEGGEAGGKHVLPEGWTREATAPRRLTGGQSLNYGYLWWPGTTAAARRDASFSAQGIHGQYLYLNPAAQVVIVVWGAQPRPTGGALVDDEAFFAAVVEALRAEP